MGGFEIFLRFFGGFFFNKHEYINFFFTPMVICFKNTSGKFIRLIIFIAILISTKYLLSTKIFFFRIFCIPYIIFLYKKILFIIADEKNTLHTLPQQYGGDWHCQKTTFLFFISFISFTHYPAHSRVGRGNLTSVLHFPLSSGSIACWARRKAELNVALCLDTRAKKWKYY